LQISQKYLSLNGNNLKLILKITNIKGLRMCLGIPMRVQSIDNFMAQCEARGITRQVNLFLVQHEEIKIGDLVMVHVGNAIQKMSEEEANLAWETYDEIFAIEEEFKAANPMETTLSG
jgi:hydrogenase expression/formation protein HypC